MQYDAFGQDNNQPVLVLLPGRHSRAADFRAHGFAEQAKRRVIVADAHFGYYRNRTVLMRIYQDVLQPLDQKKPAIGGISLGGLGAMMVAREYPLDYSEFVLIAPFMGNEVLLDRVANGEFDARPDDDELSRRILAVWSFLKTDRTPLFVGCGHSDDQAPAIRLLASLRPDARIHWVEGGHDWPAWQRIWQTYNLSSSHPSTDR